jgi:eukaryotic-like serine/threonine-protein kinase
VRICIGFPFSSSYRAAASRNSACHSRVGHHLGVGLDMYVVAEHFGIVLRREARLGPYEIISAVGAGGMGEVYRARDTRLGRDVAIKVLPESLSKDADHLARFAQEARAVAALNHPNILAVHDIGSQDGIHYIVTELLEGATLREKLSSGGLSPRRAMDYAIQIAQGLALAHEKGILHRDLKPENLFITKEGRVKILDFGLAKQTRAAMKGAADVLAVSTQTQTSEGVVVGTVGYMSPEQVRGEVLDQLSDIFAFGAVVYEMLTGRRAFQRGSSVETMNAILKEEPPELPATPEQEFPPAMQRIVRRCLEKEREHRFQSAKDLWFALDSISVNTTKSGTQAVSGLDRRWKFRVSTTLVAALLVVALTGISLGLFTRFERATPSLSFHQLTFRRGSVDNARFTPDSKTILYSARWNSDRSRIFMVREDSYDSLPLDPPGADLASIWLPGEMLVDVDFNGKDVLARVPMTGGTPRPLFEDVDSADLSPTEHQAAIVKESAGTDRIEYPPGNVIYSTAAAIGFLRFAPNGKWVAFTEWPVRADDTGWVTILDAHGKKKTSSLQFASVRGIAWNPNSEEVWFTGSKTSFVRNIYAISTKGTERLVYRAPSPLTIKDISANGQVLFTRDDVRWGITGQSQSDSSEQDYSWFDFDLAIDVSPDGKTLLFECGASAAGTYTMYLRGLDGSPAVQLGPGSAQAFSPDGKWILALTPKTPHQLLLVPVGAGEQRVLTNDSINHAAAAWFPDGKRIAFEGNEPGRPLRVYVQRLDASPPTPLTPEGTSFLGITMGQRMISSDGESIFAEALDGSPAIYNIASASARQAKGFESDDRFIRWASERDVLYVRTRTDYSGKSSLTKIYRLNIDTGERVLWKEVPSADLAGFGLYSMILTPDGKSYFYTYSRELSTLFLANGLR